MAVSPVPTISPGTIGMWIKPVIIRTYTILSCHHGSTVEYLVTMVRARRV